MMLGSSMYKASDHCIKLKLMFVCGINEEMQPAGKHDWAFCIHR